MKRDRGLFLFSESPSSIRQAWKDLGNLSKEEARREYVEKMQRKIDLVNETHDVGEWMQRDGQTTTELRWVREEVGTHEEHPKTRRYSRYRFDEHCIPDTYLT